MQYYVWELPNIHHSGYHATILTILHTSSGFQCEQRFSVWLTHAT